MSNYYKIIDKAFADKTGLPFYTKETKKIVTKKELLEKQTEEQIEKFTGRYYAEHSQEEVPAKTQAKNINPTITNHANQPNEVRGQVGNRNPNNKASSNKE